MHTKFRFKFGMGARLVIAMIVVFAAIIGGVMAAAAAPLTQASTVTVTVVDTNTTPQVGISVYAFNGSTYTGQSGTTDSNGQVQFTVADGNYNFRADIYSFQYFSGGASGTDSCTVPGCTTDTVTVPVFGSVAVTVTDGTNGLASRTVYVFDSTGTTYLNLSAVTDGGGVATFNLPAGDYQFASDDVNNVRYFSGLPACSVPTCTTATITEPVFGSVAVTVTDGANGLSGRTVYVFDSTGTTYLNLSAVTDGTGVANFNLPAGDYQFASDDVNNVRYFSGLPACSVPTCATATITVPVFGSVAVTVTDGTSGLSGRTVYVFDSTGTTYLNLSAVTDGTGVANFNLPAGDYQFASDDVNNVRYFSGLPACSVPTCTTATITEPVFGSVAVTVTDGTNGLASRTVYVFDSTGTTYLNLSAMTDGGGVANFNLPAGDYQFASDDVNNVRYFSGLPACSVPTCTAATITEPAFGPVAVTVTDTNGPVANQTVYVFDGAGTTYLNLSASTGAAGEAAAFNLPYGDYTFAADDPGNVRHFSSPACSVPTCTAASIAFAAATVDLGVTKTVDTAAPAAGSVIVYTITASNNGTMAATGVSVSDALPAGVTASSDDGGGAYSGGTWAIGNLADGASVTLHITATVASTATGTITNTATITGTETDSNPANDSASAAITIAAPSGLALCATTGSTTLPNGSTVAVWGYTSGDCTGSPTVSQPGGPVIEVNQGDTITVTLYNNLSANTALLFQGQEIIPDLVGAPAGGSKTYAFTATEPGTFLYEAGLLPNAQHQVAMGLYGALVVHPSSPSAYDEEAVLVLSEIDPALNASPASFDLRNYKPRYFLINGKAYPQTAAINTAAGHTVLLRYVNAGLQHHSMATLGLRQSLVAVDGSPLSHATNLVADTFAPGQTADAAVSVPASATGSKFALYDGSLILRNNTSAGFGGMMTFVVTSGSPPAGDFVGPTTSAVTLVGNALSATISDVGSGSSNVTAAEYFIDTVGANGSGTAMTGAFGSPTVNVNATVSLSGGTHTFYVHGQDSAGNWGPVNSVSISLDQSGPATTGLTLTPNPSNGTAAVAISASADDTAAGGSNIAAAEYTIDGGAAQAMTLNTTSAPVASLSASISAATVNALAEGSHVVSVRSQDSVGNWGTPATINLIVDKTGPTTSAVAAAPNPNNGTLGVNSSTPAVRVTATLSDAASNISTGEGFIDTVGATGTGFPFIATDGGFDSLSESAYADIPLTTIIQLSTGNHTIYVRGKDAAGNWGATSSTTLVIDKTPPSVVSINRLDPTPTSAATVQFQVTFSEGVTGVASGNFTLVQGGGLTGATITSVTGSGTTWTVTASTGTGGGSLGLNLSSATGIRDVAGNNLPSTGLPFVGQVYTVASSPLYFSTAGNSNPPGVGGSADDADIYFWSGSAFSRVIDASTLGIPGGANVDGFDRVDATHFYMSFSGNVSINPPGPNNTLSVADEDVVYYNNGTWSLFFDGSAHGLTNNNQDLDAINIVGSTLYFSTVGNTNPPGVGGTADDADIYSWNGTSFARVWDATANGLPGGANVDGLVFVDATHFYLSFSNTTTTVPGLGAVQDEDVVYYSAGTWSVYFDGTAKGLTSNNLDVDAFDLP